MPSAIARGGNPQMWAYTPASAATAGDVIAVGAAAVVLHRDYDPAVPHEYLTPQAAFGGGVYICDKDGSSGPVFAVNDPVWWNSSDGATATNTDAPFGRCLVAAGASDATVIVEHNPAYCLALEGGFSS